MRPRHACLAGLAWLVLAGPARADDQAERVFRQVAPAVVTVLAFDESAAPEGQGSGVVIGAERVATNCHVVKEAKSLKVRGAQGEFAASWARQDPARDLCLLAVPGLTAPAPKIRPLEGLAAGERVYAVGNPLGFGLAISSGLVYAVAPVKGEPAIVSTAPQSPGSSGGGLFDAEGRLMGLTTSIFGLGQNLNLALPAQWIEELASHGQRPPPPAEVPGPEPRWAEEAEALADAGDWAGLEAHARRWQADQPTAARAPNQLALALISQNRNREAEDAVREALRLDEHSASNWALLANVLHAAGRGAEAEEALTRCLAIQPSIAHAYFVRSVWRKEAGRNDEARAQIREALRLEPGIAKYWRELGVILDQAGQPDAAAQAYRTALRLHPADRDLEQTLARVLAREGKPDAARRVLGKDGGGERVADREAEATTWINLGSAELQRQRYAEAERAFRKALELAPQSPHAWLELGVALARTARPAEAAQAYERALALRPRWPNALVNRANLRSDQGDQAGALQDLEDATRIAPDLSHAWRGLGIVKAKAGDQRGAAEAYRKVVALRAATIDDWVSLGESLGRSREFGPALEALATAEQLDSRNFRVLLASALVVGNKGDVERALSYAERAVAADSASAPAWSSKGYALLRLKRLPEAVSALETATSLDPTSSNAWINLGQAQLANKNLGRAIQALEKATAIAPQALDARLYLAQSYLGTRQAAKAREQAGVILLRQADQPQALVVVVLADLMEGRGDAAMANYVRLKAKDAGLAVKLRSQVLAGGMAAARAWPE